MKYHAYLGFSIELKPPTLPQLHVYGKVSETNTLRLSGRDGDVLQPKKR